MSFLLIHGAFRAGWAWGQVPGALRAAGHRVEAPTLVGMGELAPPAERRATLSLDDWVEQLTRLAHMIDLSDIVLVGHSQGGLVARAAAPALGDRLAAVAYLDSPLPEEGQRGVDLSGPRGDRPLPPADAWLDPQPLAVGEGYTQALCDYINPRLGPTPVGPSLDPIPGAAPNVERHIAFCSLTPDGFPSSLAREALDGSDQSYVLFDSVHDVALAQPTDVVAWLEGIACGLSG
ncbi:MAG: alpha/beta hydrolase [Microthrixaceae bacterium]